MLVVLGLGVTLSGAFDIMAFGHTMYVGRSNVRLRAVLYANHWPILCYVSDRFWCGCEKVRITTYPGQALGLK